MYWLFFGSLVLLAALFGLKSYEISSNQLLFAKSLRKKLDRVLESASAAITSALKRGWHRICKALSQSAETVVSRISRTLRDLADRIENNYQ
jgi:hypothetical protein